MPRAATHELTPSQRLYRAICSAEEYASIKWIANVLFTGCGRPATRLRALKTLVDSGHEIGIVQFTMPYDAIYLDGKAVFTMPLLDRGEEVPYDHSPKFS
jgi:hypothetical protein